MAEVYYRYRLTPNLEISPDFQWVSRPGGNSKADSVKVFAIRANVAY